MTALNIAEQSSLLHGNFHVCKAAFKHAMQHINSGGCVACGAGVIRNSGILKAKCSERNAGHGTGPGLGPDNDHCP